MINYLKEITSILKQSEYIKSNIIIKGGVSLSIILDLPDRWTKDLDLYSLNKDKEELENIVNEIISLLNANGINARFIDGKMPKLKLTKEEDNNYIYEITFKEGRTIFTTEDQLIEIDGLKYINPKIVMLDKIDRFNKMACQWEEDPYNNIENFLAGNLQRDLFDIYVIYSNYKDDNNFLQEINSTFYKQKEMCKVIGSKNFANFNSFIEFIECFEKFFNILISTTFINNNYQTNFKAIFNSDSPEFRRNLKLPSFEEFTNELNTFINRALIPNH